MLGLCTVLEVEMTSLRVCDVGSRWDQDIDMGWCGKHLRTHVVPHLGNLNRVKIFLFGVLYISFNKNYSLLLLKPNYLGLILGSATY